jgi:hypothetical protein
MMMRTEAAAEITRSRSQRKMAEAWRGGRGGAGFGAESAADFEFVPSEGAEVSFRAVLICF